MPFPEIPLQKHKIMAKNKKPTKKYTPKPVKSFVTKGLYDELGADLHFPLLSMFTGTPSAGAWKKIAKVIMTVSFATDGDTRIDKADKAAIDSAVLTLRTISDTQVRTGKWRMTDLEYLSLSRGVTAVDKVLARIDYLRLARGYAAFTKLVSTIKGE